MISTRSLGFGTNGIQEQAIFDMAIRQGYRLFDTADKYDNAKELHDAMLASKISRDEFFINYKIIPGLGKEEFIRHLDKAIDTFTHLDCIMLHDMKSDNGIAGIREILEALQPYIDQGKVKHIGLSNCEAFELKELLPDFPNIKFVQNAFSHAKQDTTVREFCRAHDISYMGYGIFGGRTEISPCGVPFYPIESAWNTSAVTWPRLTELAVKHGKTPADLILCWALQQGTIQIPGSTRAERIASNLALHEFARAMSLEDQRELASALINNVSPAEMGKIEEDAKEDSGLTKLQALVGNDLPRHRLLSSLYQEPGLKYFIDFMCERVKSGENKEAKFIENKTEEYLIILCSFMEGCLRASDQQYHEMIKVLDNIVRNTTSEYEKNHFLSELFSKMGNLEEPLSCVPNVLKYQDELDYFHQNGYFEIKELSLPQPQVLDSHRVAIVGANNIIYLLSNLNLYESLQDVCNLLLEQFPEDFRNSDQLESFYTSTMNPDARIVKPSEDINFIRLGFTPGEVYGLAGQPDCQRLMRFFHSLYNHPVVFTGGREISKSFVAPDSPAYDVMRERVELITHERDLKRAAEYIEIKKSRLSGMGNDSGKKDKFEAAYQEDVKEFSESKERYAASRAAFLEKLKRASRSGEKAKDVQESISKSPDKRNL